MMKDNINCYCYHWSCQNEATKEIWDTEEDTITVCDDHLQQYRNNNQEVTEIQ